MTSKPILFSGPMVRAILDGRKSQTRRVLKLYPSIDNKRFVVFPPEEIIELEPGEFQRSACNYLSTAALSGPYKLPYASGDLLWVREAWATVNSECGPGWAYKANGAFEQPAYDGEDFGAGPSFNYDKYPGEYTMWFSDLLAGAECHSWKPSIHMPRWASRLTLEVTSIRVERVQDISAEDAQAEGVPTTTVEQTFVKCFRDPDERAAERIKRFRKLWDSLNAKRGYGWDRNPWVCAVTFKTHHCNVDAMEKAE